METWRWQPSLLDDAGGDDDGGRAATTAPAWPPSVSGVTREHLDAEAWVDLAPRWLPGADDWFARVAGALEWRQRHERIRGEHVPQPRLTDHRELGDLEGELAPLAEVGRALSCHYGVRFERLGSNLYRDGRDSVAWHGDRVAREREWSVVAIVSLGEPRRFRLRPRGGGDGRAFDLGHGDLLVMGGACQRTWQHAVPKVARAGPRISLTFRHDYPPRPA